VMATEVLLATTLVVAVNVAVVAPEATVTLVGTCAAAALLLDSVTTAPPVGAGLVIVTVPVDEFPPTTEAGLKVTVLRSAAVIVKTVLWVVPRVAEMLRETFAVTVLVVIAKLAELAFAGTVTLAGTCAAVLLLARAATIPAVGAGPVRITVPTADAPPGTDVGLTVTELTTGAFTVKLAFWVEP
jgi:hypothetical protein